MGHIEEAIHTGVDPVEEERTVMLLGVIQGEPLISVRMGARTLAVMG
jgi:hypothetical protein